MAAVPNIILHAVDADRLLPAAREVESDFARALVLQQPHLARLIQRLLGWEWVALSNRNAAPGR